jgi:large subunit ribosomal protein L10
VKGGLHGEGLLSAQDLARLADLPSREVLLAGVAAAIAAPLRQLAGLLQALPRSFAYGLHALIEERGGPPPAVQEEPPAVPQAPEGGVVAAAAAGEIA